MLWTRRTKTGLFALIAMTGLSLTGCVERRYTIRSDPPGALVIVNDEEIGTAPVSRNYTFSGDRHVRLMREGYETFDVIQPMDAPWWDNVLTEFFSENLIPYTLRDDREFTFKMKPEESTDTNALLTRAESLRSQGRTIPPPRRKGLLGFFGFD